MYQYVKRILDIFWVLFFMVLFLPLFLIIPLIIYLGDGKNPIFKQKRVGQHGVSFDFYKFRSMSVDTPDVESTDITKLKITPIGKIIRKTNLDEIAQVYNILKGDMTGIGPRPPIVSQKKLIELRRLNGSLSLKPGVTGWAQVNSYDNMPEEEKARLDGEYAEKISFKFDVIIFLMTFNYFFFKKNPTY